MKSISKGSISICVLGLWVFLWIGVCVYQEQDDTSTFRVGRFIKWTTEIRSAAENADSRSNYVHTPELENITTIKLGHGLSRQPTSMNSSVNVLLLAYQRSGSSLLGEILSVRPDAMYVFEPLIEISCRRRIYNQKAIVSHLKNLYRCNAAGLDLIGRNRIADIQILRKVSNGSVHREPEVGCRDSKVRVIKTIRLSMRSARLMAADESLGLKIVHLVRDPRAILNSMAPSSTWTNTSKSPFHQCDGMRRDLNAGAALPAVRYTRVRYEDLIENPVGVATDLYRFLGVAAHKSLPFYLATHTESERFYKNVQQKIDYFTTYRKSSYDGQSWRDNMTVTRRKEIEKECWDVIRSLGYEDVLSGLSTEVSTPHNTTRSG